jgi:hypothetical protein
LKWNWVGHIDVNGTTTFSWGSGPYYLFYPVYSGTRFGENASSYSLTWHRYEGDGNNSIPPKIEPTGDLRFGGTTAEGNVRLNRSGLWLIDDDYTHNCSSFSSLNSTVPAWFWVNTSRSLSIAEISDDDFYYDDSETLTVRVTEGGASANAMVAIFAGYNGKLITISGITSSLQTDGNGYVGVADLIHKNSTVFPYAGYYNVTAVWDWDGGGASVAGSQTFYYDGSDNYQYYNSSYGSATYHSTINNSGSYSYPMCGPWDPPEKNATWQEIYVRPGEPTMAITNDTQYWGFEGRIDVNITNDRGDFLSGLNVTVVNQTGTFPYAINGSESVASASRWQYGSSYYNAYFINNFTNGSAGTTWTIYAAANLGGSSVEEWNGTTTFTVASAPGLQIKVTNDGDGNNDLKVDAGPPAQGSLPWAIEFKVVNSTHDYYGSTATYGTEAMAMGNISIAGDAWIIGDGLTLEELNDIGDGMVNYWSNTNTWKVNLTPMMDTAADGGGKVTISATWADHGGTAEPVTIVHGGNKYNGSLVTISPSEIPIDQNVTLEVTVTDPSNPAYGYYGVRVYLYYINDSGGMDYTFNNTLTTTYDGKATFHFNKTQQTDNQTNVDGWSTYAANRYVAAYVDIGNSEYGYGYAKLLPQQDFKVTWEAQDTTSTAGTSVIMAGRDYDRFWFNVSIIGAGGNTTDWPTIGSGQDELNFRIFNSTGHDVTNNISASFTATNLVLDSTSDNANHSLSGSSHYIREPGTYTVYAYNKTHDSTGNNATITVTPVDLESDLGEYIWNVDKNVTDTYTIRYLGDLVNGTLVIDNMTHMSSSKFNKTWTNCSYDGSTDQGGNTSKKDIQVTNGVVTIHNITANNLSEWLSEWKHYSQMNISFWFKSSKPGSQYARVGNKVLVKIADVAPTPETLAYNQPAELEILVTGRGAGLADVFVSIIVPGLSGEMNTTTNADGTATFAFEPPSTGNILIRVENRTSDTKIPVTSWKLYLDVASQVDELSTFTVTVRNRTAGGGLLNGVDVTFDRETKTTVDGQVTFTAPDVKATKDYTVTAQKYGYADDSVTVSVLYIPQLFMTVSASKDGEKYVSPVTVTVYDDTGKLITGAEVTFGTITKITIDGVATFEITDETSGMITATFEGFQAADPIEITITPGGIPGFELLTLIAAIGVAFILLRRRRH